MGGDPDARSGLSNRIPTPGLSFSGQMLRNVSSGFSAPSGPMPEIPFSSQIIRNAGGSGRSFSAPFGRVPSPAFDDADGEVRPPSVASKATDRHHRSGAARVSSLDNRRGHAQPLEGVRPDGRERGDGGSPRIDHRHDNFFVEDDEGSAQNEEDDKNLLAR